MPTFLLNTEQYIIGTVMANYTSGAQVRGNLTLKASVRPIKPIDLNRKLKKNRPKPIESNLYNPYGHNDFWKPEGYHNTYGRFDDDPRRTTNYDNPYDNYYDTYDRYDDRPLVEKYYTFNEVFPSWMSRNDYWESVPSLKFVIVVYFRLNRTKLISIIAVLRDIRL